MKLAYPPPYQDIETLCAHLCVSPSTVDHWMRLGRLPPAKVSESGKRLWKWKEVESCLDTWDERARQSSGSEAERITNAVKRAYAPATDRAR